MWIAGECRDTKAGILFKAGSLLEHAGKQTGRTSRRSLWCLQVNLGLNGEEKSETGEADNERKRRGGSTEPKH